MRDVSAMPLPAYLATGPSGLHVTACGQHLDLAAAAGTGQELTVGPPPARGQSHELATWWSTRLTIDRAPLLSSGAFACVVAATVPSQVWGQLPDSDAQGARLWKVHGEPITAHTTGDTPVPLWVGRGGTALFTRFTVQKEVPAWWLAGPCGRTVFGLAKDMPADWNTPEVSASAEQLWRKVDKETELIHQVIASGRSGARSWAGAVARALAPQGLLAHWLHTVLTGYVMSDWPGAVSVWGSWERHFGMPVPTGRKAAYPQPPMAAILPGPPVPPEETTRRLRWELATELQRLELEQASRQRHADELVPRIERLTARLAELN